MLPPLERPSAPVVPLEPVTPPEADEEAPPEPTVPPDDVTPPEAVEAPPEEEVKPPEPLPPEPSSPVEPSGVSGSSSTLGIHETTRRPVTSTPGSAIGKSFMDFRRSRWWVK